MANIKTPNTPDELLALQDNEESLYDRVVDMLNEDSAHPCEVISLTQGLAELLLSYHLDFIKDKGDELSPESKIAWEDDAQNILQAVKYLGRVRR